MSNEDEVNCKLLNPEEYDYSDRIYFDNAFIGLKKNEFIYHLYLPNKSKKYHEGDKDIFSIVKTDNLEEVIDVAKNNLTMPPKTTWFDPKPLDGLVVYEFK